MVTFTIILLLILIFLCIIMLYNRNIILYKAESFITSTNKCIDNCVDSHSQNGDDYMWLNQLGHGKVVNIYFEEPVNSGKWTLYDDNWWKVHCKVIDHRPDNLVKSHVDAFINPHTRFARLMFTFQDGKKMEPTKEFYELEANYFRNNKLCK